VKSTEAETLIDARPSTVWDILTDTSNVAVWESGITAIEGELRDGGTIRVRTNAGERGGVRMRVRQMPGEVMRWRAALPMGMLRRTFTVILTPEAGLTHLRISHELVGLLSPFASNRLPASPEVLQAFVGAVKKRAELLDRHL
jgi:uncharacterized protein YndB with AHSA1/START domain